MPLTQGRSHPARRPDVKSRFESVLMRQEGHGQPYSIPDRIPDEILAAYQVEVRMQVVASRETMAVVWWRSTSLWMLIGAVSVVVGAGFGALLYASLSWTFFARYVLVPLGGLALGAILVACCASLVRRRSSFG